jgi:uncharacterized membrane protein
VAYEALKYLHVIGATVLLGTGTGIAFFMLMAHRTQDAGFIARTAAVVVIADAIFTAGAVVAQPVTGYLLLRQLGLPIATPWVAVSIALYVVAGLFWLPVISMQMRLRDLAAEATANGTALPPAYHRLFRWWLAFGFPGFGTVLAIIWLMIAKPALW